MGIPRPIATIDETQLRSTPKYHWQYMSICVSPYFVFVTYFHVCSSVCPVHHIYVCVSVCVFVSCLRLSLCDSVCLTVCVSLCVSHCVCLEDAVIKMLRPTDAHPPHFLAAALNQHLSWTEGLGRRADSDDDDEQEQNIS